MVELMKAVQIETDKPLFLADYPLPEPQPGEVLIKVAASGLNRADLLQRRGMYPPPKGASQIMGLECAGEIVGLGDGVNGWTLGDKVCALLAGGGYASYACVDQGALLPVPEGMDLIAAAALPEAMMTVWANVFDHARLKTDEAVLIHGGTSGIGVMALQMLRVFGIKEIYATAGSDEKCEKITALGGTCAINYRTQDFEEIITASGGVDVILDMVGGEYVQKNISIARRGGRIVNIAYMQGPVVTVNLLPVMLKALILTGTTLRARPNAEKARLRKGVQETFWAGIEAGQIQPIVDTVYPAADADAAHAHMAKGGHIGKIILDWSDVS